MSVLNALMARVYKMRAKDPEWDPDIHALRISESDYAALEREVASLGRYVHESRMPMRDMKVMGVEIIKRQVPDLEI